MKLKFFSGVFLVMMLLFTINISNASAHAYIVNSSPSENESLDDSPTKATIEYNEKIQSGFAVLNVTNSAGEKVDEGNVIVEGKTISVDLKANLKNDVYTMEWRVVSADGHSITGLVPFSIGELPEGVVLPQEQYTADKSSMVSVSINKVLLYSGFSLYMGLVLFYLVWFRPNGLEPKIAGRTKRYAVVALTLIGLGLLSFIVIQTQVNAGVSFFQALKPSLLLETLQSTKEGTIWSIQMVLFLLLVLAQVLIFKKGALLKKIMWILPLISFVGILLCKAFIGHPSSSPYENVAIIMNFFHLTAASIWLGGIIVIIFLLKEGIFAKEGEQHDIYWNTLQSYSMWALFTVAVLAISGAVNGSLLIPDFHSLVSTAYGITLLVKVGIFALMIGFGAYHLVSRTMLSRQKFYKKTIKIEMVLGVLLLMVTSVFTQLQTPTLPIDKPFYSEAEISYNENLSLAVSPKKTGIQNQYEVNLFDNDRDPLKDPEQITIELKQGDQQTSFTLEKAGEGKYTAENLQLNSPGKWEATVHLLFKDLDSYDIPFEFNVR
ncbi:copper resistance protein CopC [Niallia taxi]|uniref:copper resistance protein CopC n=1 Tax=Niallia taxi TaxID=2499688 RepID=UPI0029348408|nr:copper resistance protein CopC [Niallia taxi]WOD61390.1 copper resistance protein CopC [Niallia taxi]